MRVTRLGFPKSLRIKQTQRKSNLVQLRLVGLQGCGLKSCLNRHRKQTEVLLKGVEREEQADFDRCYLNARVDETKAITGRNEELAV